MADFYNLETLYHFARVKVAGIPHSVYAGLAKAVGLCPVDNLDGIKLTDYLHGKTDKVPDNVKNVSFRELNPIQNDNRDLQINVRPDEPVFDPAQPPPSFFHQGSESLFQRRNDFPSDNFNYERSNSQQQTSSTLGHSSFNPTTFDYQYPQLIDVGTSFRPGEGFGPDTLISSRRNRSVDRSSQMSFSSSNSSVVEVEPTVKIEPTFENEHFESTRAWEIASPLRNSNRRLEAKR
jgi:hypothetical protein